MREPFILTEKHGRVAVLTLNRADIMNPISEQADCDEFVAALDAISADPEIAAMILTGSGRAFSAGGNLKAIRERVGVARLDSPIATRQNYRRGIQKVIRALYDLEIPSIAAVNGHAIGLGNDLACVCDIRIASSAAKFAASFIKIGIVPGDGGAWLLPRVVSYSKAAELLFTGDTVSAEDALEIGLVSRVVSPEALLAEALELAQRIAANPPQTLRMSKRLLRESQNTRFYELLEMSAAFQAIVHETEDHEEALSAFVEKRKPVFKGR
jgi:2-(1,2-epoxy-1,2-dihydrophenyl)acetyl-CoA isomerase